MKQQHKYENLIREKLNAIPAPDITGLWDSMEAILDKEMPQPKEEKRRFLFWRLNSTLLIAATVLFVVGGTVGVYKLADRMAVATPNNTSVAKQNAAGRPSNNIATRAVTPNSVASNSVDNNTNANNTNGIANKTNPVVTRQSANNTNAISITNPGASSENNTNNTSTSSNKNNPVAVNGKKAINPIVRSASVSHRSAKFRINPETLRRDDVAGIKAIINANNNTTIKNGTVAENNSAFGNDNSSVKNDDLSTATHPVIEALPTTLVNGAAAQVQTLTAADFAITYPKKKRTTYYLDKGISVGVGLNYTLPVSNQVKNESDINGRNGSLFAYMPSVYAQYHISRKFYLQAELQPVSQQYTPNFTLYDRSWQTYPNVPEERDEKKVMLNKLFYTSIPVSAHYSLIKNLTIGAGVQYSRLKKVILQDQEYHHTYSLWPNINVWTIQETKNEVAVKDPNAIQHSSGDVVDSVVNAIKKHDVRLLADVNYQYKSISVGVRYTQGMINYVNTNFNGTPVKDKNESLQLYLRVNLFDGRKRKY